MTLTYLLTVYLPAFNWNQIILLALSKIVYVSNTRCIQFGITPELMLVLA